MIGKNPLVVPLVEIPIFDYTVFMDTIADLMKDESRHCVAYHVVPLHGKLRFFCCMASDHEKNIVLLSHEQNTSPLPVLPSLTAAHFLFHMYEREIWEQYGIQFIGHPWLKPVRVVEDYPFYSIEGDGVHEVGVGPIHAGIIEPGYFRFSCNGEKVMHLEIQLGFQHRGVEKLFLEKPSGIQRAVLAESIAGDTSVGHSIAHSQLMETLAGIISSPALQCERIIALELERIAVHIGDTAALCTDIAYQFGQVVNEALRTIVINTTQSWCGNRFGKGLVRTGGSYYPLKKDFILLLLANLKEVEERFGQITHEIFTNPSVLSRFEGIGKVSPHQAGMIGAVGMAARSSGVKRDIRWSHPFQAFRKTTYEPVTLHQGDAWARAMLRKLEVEKSIQLIGNLLSGHDFERMPAHPVYELTLPASSFALSLAEGWRGEIMQSAVTDEKGNIMNYKVKDPSFHNWMALTLAVRNQEISDFPLCNKSYNLSYCGHDL
ncbi:MAG: NADH-quinone oxidoreductase subunit C [Bacteroidetes bacterium]|nr:NADH-quinone oxidoreductase subunit C [Bacteroidota bacterium]